MTLSPSGQLWHKEQIEKYTKEHHRYETFASFLESVLKKICGKYAPLAIVQTRAKTVPSFAEKAIRKLPKSDRLITFTSVQQWTEYFDPVNQFTDLCGARVITQTQEQTEKISHFIRNYFEIDEINSEDKQKGLRPDQFGYLSVHYIVQVPSRGKIFGVPVNSNITQLKAEIQVRTLLQHAWADISHDNLYKHQFSVPEKWQRDMARIAAVLEATDKEFTQFVDSLHTFAGNFRTYMTQDQIDEELARLQLLVTYAEKEEDKPLQINLALRKASIFEGLADWPKVECILSPYKKTKDVAVLKKTGNALCRRCRNTPHAAKYKKGRQYLEKAIQIDANESNMEKAIEKCKDAEVLAYYAWSWEPDDKMTTRTCYSKAYSLQPSNPYYLASFLEYEIATQNTFFNKSLIEPALLAAIKTCRSHAEVGIELPNSLFTIGRLSLLLGKPHQSLLAYIKAVDLYLSPETGIPEQAIENELAFLHGIKPMRDSLEGYDWICMLLLIAKVVKTQTQQSSEELAKLSNSKVTYKGPVVVIAGSCALDEEERLGSYRVLITEALSGFSGEVISGGTTSGVSGIVGDLLKTLAPQKRQIFRTIGYLPSSIPKDAHVDNEGYGCLIYTEDHEFSPLQPLQMWLDLIASGIHPSQVKMIGVGGGSIAAIEYRLALALGASLGVFADSRRAAAELLQDAQWQHHRNLVTLIPDPMTIRALFLSPSSHIGMESIEKAAKNSHENTIREKREKCGECIDPSRKPWPTLDEKFRHSSIQQKLYAEAILRYEGYGLREKDPEKIKVIEFSEEKLDRMAEMEHGRWNLERTKSGWKKGAERDPDNKLSPYLVSWNELSDDVKKYDVDYVKGWPEDFKEAGIEIYALEKEKQ